MRFFIDYLWDCNEVPHQQWAVFAENSGKTVVYFKALNGKPSAERVCNRARYDYARLGDTVTADVMALPEVVQKTGKKGQVIGYEIKKSE